MVFSHHIFHQPNSRNHESIFGSTNLKYIIAGIAFSINVWWIFKCFYPYPNLTFDSYYYIKAAVINTDVCGWPIGYAKFIRWLGLITHSANFLVSIQYFLLQISFIYFLITIRYIFLLNNISSIVIFVFLFINPLFPYACNHILSDLLYTSLSIIWATLLIWVIYRFRPYMVLVQGLLVVMIFSLRYNAIYYPLISIFAFIVARQSWTWKIMGIGLTIIFLWAFIEYTSIKMQETVGIRKYSYSGGWKLASSALYMYEYEFKNDYAPVPKKFKQIDSIVRKYYNEPHYIPSLYKADEEITLGSYYMAVDVSPLMQYMHYKYNDYEWSLDFHKTAPFGPFYQEYGLYLIKKHPFAYFKYVIMPQIVSYIIPYQEMFGIDLPPFTLWDDEYGQITRKWFDLDTLMVPLPRIKSRLFLLSPFPYLFALVHLIFFVSLIFFLLFQEYKKVSRLVFHSIILLALICIVNFLFVATTTTGVLRYQFFVVVLELGLILVIFEIFFNFKVGREP